jgi:SSS family solute:Na+ symporter
MIWLPLYLLFYVMVTLYWARIAAQANGNHQTYFSAGHSLQPWVSALVLAGASLSGWVILGGASEVARHGFSQAALLQAGVALALPGVFFFKRLWLIAERLRLSSQAEVLRSYYRSEFLVVVSTLIAVLFAIGFAGMQLRALSDLVAHLTGGAVTAAVAGVVLSVVLFGYVVIGGMRAIGYLGAIQAVLLAASLIGLAGFALAGLGGFGALNTGLLALAADPDRAGLFSVAGVIQFTAGIGREAAAGHEGTALASLGLFFALMGFQASPMAAKIVMSTRSPRGLGAGQTWVLAGFGGALVVGCMGVLGAAALIDPRLTVPALLGAISPWFSAWLFIGLLAGVQLLAGLALLTAGEALVRHVYKPWFQSALGSRQTVTVTRVVIGLLALISVCMQALTPVTLSALGALALPLSVQLWTPLLGICWLRWLGRGAVMAGVGFGVAGVLLTEPAGHAALSFLGLDLPWGRWPWTLHSALWGLVPNLCVAFLIAAFTQRHKLNAEAQDVRQLLDVALHGGPRLRALKTTAWAAVMAWLFLAAGPGLIFGNAAFVGTDGIWLVGMPSLWAWAVLFWAAGLGLVWFLSYKMEMASPLTVHIPPYAPPPRLRPDQTQAEKLRLRAALTALAVGSAAVVLTVLSFGG